MCGRGPPVMLGAIADECYPDGRLDAVEEKIDPRLLMSIPCQKRGW
jgi:hypothetical protein